jgi:hypothetical protein
MNSELFEIWLNSLDATEFAEFMKAMESIKPRESGSKLKPDKAKSESVSPVLKAVASKYEAEGTSYIIVKGKAKATKKAKVKYTKAVAKKAMGKYHGTDGTGPRTKG